MEKVSDLGAAAAASMPGASAAVPLTLVGGVGSGYKVRPVLRPTAVREVGAHTARALLGVLDPPHSAEQSAVGGRPLVILSQELLPLLAAGKGIPVEGLIVAVERQAALTTQLGGFMQLIVKLDQANMRTVRQAWETHGRPATVRELARVTPSTYRACYRSLTRCCGAQAARLLER